MCFSQCRTASDALHVQGSAGGEAAQALAGLAGAEGLSAVDVVGSGTPDAVVAPRGERVLDGYSRAMDVRWNLGLELTVTLCQGEETQVRCRVALDELSRVGCRARCRRRLLPTRASCYAVLSARERRAA